MEAVGPQRQIDDSRRAGRGLATAFQRGVPIHCISAPIRLQPGEHCVATQRVQLMQFVGTDASWTETRGGGWGLGTMLLMGTVNTIGNSHRKAKALQEAAPQWRVVGGGQMWLTDRRFAIAASEWVNLWHEDLNSATCDGLSIEAHYPGMPPNRLVLPYADWWYVMLHWITFAEIVFPPLPAFGPA